MIYSDKIYNFVFTTNYIYNELVKKNDKILENDNLIFFLIDKNHFYNNKELIASSLYFYDMSKPINLQKNVLYMNEQTMQCMISDGVNSINIPYSINKSSMLACQEKMNKIKISETDMEEYIYRATIKAIQISGHYNIEFDQDVSFFISKGDEIELEIHYTVGSDEFIDFIKTTVSDISNSGTEIYVDNDLEKYYGYIYIGKSVLKVKNPYKGQILVYNGEGEARLSGVTIQKGSINKDHPSYGSLVTDTAVKKFIDEQTLSKDKLISNESDLENASDDNVATAKTVLDALTWKTDIPDIPE